MIHLWTLTRITEHDNPGRHPQQDKGNLVFLPDCSSVDLASFPFLSLKPASAVFFRLFHLEQFTATTHPRDLLNSVQPIDDDVRRPCPC